MLVNLGGTAFFKQGFCNLKKKKEVKEDSPELFL